MMKIATLQHMIERIIHANKTHGEFKSAFHATSAARLELAEAEHAIAYEGAAAFAAELLDVAVVCIRAAEQFQGTNQLEETK